MRFDARLLAVLLVAGCASTPDDDPLVWSDDVVRTLPRERGAVVEVARFSRLRAGDSLAPWEPWLIVRGNTPTSYRVAEVDGVAALEADSAQGGSGMWRKVRIDPHAQPVMEWRWRVPAEVETRLEKNSSTSPAVRLSLAFHGDPGKLDFDDRVKLRMARALTVNGLPYASLLYVWMVGVPVDTVLHSPHTDRVRMIVAESSVKRAGEWITLRRNVLEDYRRAFGEEPDDIVAVGLMTDPGDDGSRRRAFYGDITFRSGE
ncbi:MAG TPA: DUF3047 domain-containing protein [Burkholderiales bacterium]|nr:DUF3047 domain-containing protein [Burkholderiales bacterium]